ncbi:MAG: hypothetical protein IJI08_09600, partial [Clostridia bacterium]|nr:hypothetical protein [Clostridia bacterium]
VVTGCVSRVRNAFVDGDPGVGTYDTADTSLLSYSFSQHGMIHAYAGEEALAAYKETVGKDCVSVFFDAKKFCEQPNHSGYAEVLAAFNEQAQLYLLGEKSIEDTMADFISHRDAILAQNK